MATQSDSSMSLGKIGYMFFVRTYNQCQSQRSDKDFLGICCKMQPDRLLMSSDINVPDN